MKNALMTILKSKRVLLGIGGIIIPLIMKAFDLDADAADRVWQTCIVLIVGQSASDWGRNKYLTYQREIVELFDDGNNYIEIARHLIDKYCLGVSVDYLRKEVKEIVHYTIADKEIVEYNVRLSKQKQKLQDLNRISNKAFREQARIENALEEYNKELIKLLKSESLSVKIKKHKGETKASLLIQIADTHFNELVSIETNSYDFKIASKRLQKYAYHIKQYIGLYNIKEALVCITGDLLNSDRRLDEL